MAEVQEANYRNPIVSGQAFNVMPIPIIPKNVEWFDAGPVSFAVEARVLGEGQGEMSGGGGSIHVFSGDREQEWVRFDCFDSTPHYHYINQAAKRNVAWGYDAGVNGPMAPWAIAAIGERLPSILRSAGAEELAGQVERDGFDKSVLEKVARAVMTAHERTLHDDAMLQEGQDWYAAWKERNPGTVTSD